MKKYLLLPLLLAAAYTHASGLCQAVAGTGPLNGQATSDIEVFHCAPASSGAVTSVALTAPNIFAAVGGSPVTTAGTLALSLATQSANLVWGGPATGSAAAPTFRALVAADLPAGTTPISSIPSATIGLTAVSGIATTFMTSDSAPPLSQAIAPSWTGTHTFTANPIVLLAGTSGNTWVRIEPNATTNNGYIDYYSPTGFEKWQAGIGTSANNYQYYIYDAASTRNDLTIASSGAMSIMPSGGALALGSTGATTTMAGPTTFISSDLEVLGSSTGYTALASANASATNYVATLPAATDTVVELTQTQTLTNKSIVATQLTGTLAAAQEPAHTGDVTNTAGSLALTVVSIAGTKVNPNSSTTNTAMGASALTSVTGTSDTAFGSNALKDATGDPNDTAVGANALYNATTGGGYNTAIGVEALGNNAGTLTTGNGNNAFGYQALEVVTTSGSNNIGFGANAGASITTGNNNVAIGPSVASATLTTGSNNILIGTSAAVDTVAAATSNEINIGKLLFYNNASVAAPAVTACGTSPSIDANANNRSGTVTAGTVTATSCTITFAGSGYSSWNHCRVTPHSTVATFAYSYTKTVITITGTTLVSDVFDYDCDGY